MCYSGGGEGAMPIKYHQGCEWKTKNWPWVGSRPQTCPNGHSQHLKRTHFRLHFGVTLDFSVSLVSMVTRLDCWRWCWADVVPGCLAETRVFLSRRLQLYSLLPTQFASPCRLPQWIKQLAVNRLLWWAQDMQNEHPRPTIRCFSLPREAKAARRGGD